MDEVVADWLGYARNVVGHDFKLGERLSDVEWNLLRSHKRIFRDLKVRRGAYNLVDWIERYANDLDNRVELVAFLTAVPRTNDMPWAFHDKTFWAQRHFPWFPVFFGPYSHDKQYHCKPGDVLIDDRKSNIVEWRAAGGLAHQYTEWPECQAWLEANLK